MQLYRLLLYGSSLLHLASSDKYCGLAIDAIYDEGETLHAFQGTMMYSVRKIVEGVPIVDRNKKLDLQKQANYGTVETLSWRQPKAALARDGDLLILTSQQVEDKLLSSCYSWKKQMWEIPCNGTELIEGAVLNEKLALDAVAVDPKHEELLVALHDTEFKQSSLVHFNNGKKEFEFQNSTMNGTLWITGLAFAKADEARNWYFVIWERKNMGQFFQMLPVDSINQMTSNDHDIRYGSHWAGCPQDLCLEGDIDSIVYNSNNYKYEVRRGYYIYKISLIGAKIEEIDKLAFIVDATYYDGKKRNVVNIIDRRIIIGSDKFPSAGNLSFSTFSSDEFVTAALIIDSNLHLLTSFGLCHIYSYVQEQDTHFEHLTTTNITDRFPGITGPIDSALYDESTEIIYFFRKDYHVKYDVKSKVIKSGPSLNANNIWSCQDEETLQKYYLNQWFNVTSMNQYHKKMKKFRMPKNFVSRQRNPNKKNNYVLVVIIVSIFAAIILLCGAFFLFYFHKRRKRLSKLRKEQREKEEREELQKAPVFSTTTFESKDTELPSVATNPTKPKIRIINKK